MLGHKHDHWNITRMGEIETPRRLDWNIVGVKSQAAYWSVVQDPEFWLALLNWVTTPLCYSSLYFWQFIQAAIFDGQFKQIDCLIEEHWIFLLPFHIYSTIIDCMMIVDPVYHHRINDAHPDTGWHKQMILLWLGPSQHLSVTALISYHLSHHGR